ncbi:hypothetical protein AB0M02_39485 [Actinoplanes sp. NPDC051861]|uniref:hypothetical protein n=1 Tax=Actinoplanes sp. NPDC051861 TaxID=3155170 RepID=UPI003417D54E
MTQMVMPYPQTPTTELPLRWRLRGAALTAAVILGAGTFPTPVRHPDRGTAVTPATPSTRSALADRPTSATTTPSQPAAASPAIASPAIASPAIAGPAAGLAVAGPAAASLAAASLAAASLAAASLAAANPVRIRGFVYAAETGTLREVL